MKNNLTRYILVANMLLSLKVVSQSTSELNSVLSKDVAMTQTSKTLFVKNSLNDILSDIRNHKYDHLTHANIMEYLLYNPEIAHEWEKIIQKKYWDDLYNPEKYEYIIVDMINIVRYIIIKKWLLLFPTQSWSFVVAPIKEQSQISCHDIYLKQLFPNIKFYQDIEVYRVNSENMPFVATAVNGSIIVNDYGICEEYKELMSATKTQDTVKDDFINAVYANEKTHIYYEIAYGTKIKMNDVLQSWGINYNAHQIEEMLSDALSIKHDKRYIYVCIRNMIDYGYIGDASLVPQYLLATHVVQHILESKNIKIKKWANGYVLSNIIVWKSSEQAAEYIYNHFSDKELEDIADSYFTIALAWIQKIDKHIAMVKTK